MKIEHLDIDGAVLIELDVRSDERGFFVERYRRSAFEELGLPTRFEQDNHSRSNPGVLRGIHYQVGPPQGKLVGVARGRIWDVAVDIRLGSPTYGKSYGVELNDTNGRLLWIPPGCAHAFCVLGDGPADVVYKADAEYNPAGDKGILWSDPDLGIEWPINDPVISKRDAELPTFAEYTASYENKTTL